MRTTTFLTSLAAFAALTSAQHQDQPSHYDHQRQRRWVWGPSIIQDPTSGQDTATLPPIGSNVNQFTTPAQTITTPDSTPTMPTFPPLESSSSSSASSQSYGGGKQGAAAAGTTTPASSSTIRRIPFVERKSSSLAAASSQPSPPTTTPASSSPSTTPATSRIVGHRTTTPPPPPPPTPTTPPPTPQPTTTPAETHRVLWHERHESYLFSILGSKRDVPSSPTASPASTTPAAGGYGRSTPDPGTALHPPTFSGPPGTMPSGGVPGSYAISHLPSSSASSSSTTTPAQAVPTGGVLDVVQEAVGEVAGVVSGAVNGVGGMIGLGKREASSPSRFQVVVKRRAEHSTSHQRRRRTVSVE